MSSYTDVCYDLILQVATPSESLGTAAVLRALLTGSLAEQ